MDSFKKFFGEFGGAIIGGLIALIIICTSFYKLIIGLVLIFFGMIAGNYIQKNKFDVKEKIKNFIDRL